MRKAALLFFVLILSACGEQDARLLNGYVESDTLMMAPQEGGVIAEVAVEEGEAVAPGQLLFRLDDARAAFALKQAEASAASAKARAENAGALDQAVAEAQAQFEAARKTYERSKELVRTKVATKARLDSDTAAYESAKARLERARSERNSAADEWQAAEAAVGLAKRRLDDMRVAAPKAGAIERIYRRPGEVIAAGEPVLALLPPDNVKLRFYAPEPMLSSLKVGETVDFSCDGCAPRTARISYIATEPQFTPPIIYSLDERAKLVFLIEARPLDPQGLRPGLPVDVRVP